MMNDDEIFIFRKDPKTAIEQIEGFTRENAKDILAVGFDVKKTFLFSDRQFLSTSGPAFLGNVLKVSDRLAINQSNGALGIKDSSSIEKALFPHFFQQFRWLLLSQRLSSIFLAKARVSRRFYVLSRTPLTKIHIFGCVEMWRMVWDLSSQLLSIRSSSKVSEVLVVR